MNVLILGGGYIGNHVFNSLSKIHNTLQVVQRDVDYTCNNKYPGSKDFKSFLHDNRIDVAVNCSGYTGSPNVDACEKNKPICWEYNVLAPQRTIHILNLFRIPVIHISSGCIYQGANNYTEQDEPNFGLYSNNSSFYSKSKHAGELALKDTHTFLFRIRMPFCNELVDKNILRKYLKYEKLISRKNSLTSVYDLCGAVEHFCVHRNVIEPGIYNIVNKGSLDAEEVIYYLRQSGMSRRDWRVVEEDALELVAKRSNCTLSGDKLTAAGFNMPHVTESLQQCAQRMERKMNGRV